MTAIDAVNAETKTPQRSDRIEMKRNQRYNEIHWFPWWLLYRIQPKWILSQENVGIHEVMFQTFYRRSKIKSIKHLHNFELTNMEMACIRRQVFGSGQMSIKIVVFRLKTAVIYYRLCLSLNSFFLLLIIFLFVDRISMVKFLISISRCHREMRSFCTISQHHHHYHG